MTTPTERIRRALGLPDDARTNGRIDTFIRCNGAAGLIKAAGAVGNLRTKVAIGDPWAYCVSVFNADIGRAVDLYPRLHLAEHGLRTRIDAAMTRGIGRRWFEQPEAFLPTDIAQVIRSDDQFRSVQDRQSGSAAPYLVKAASGLAFAERTPFWLVQSIIRHNHAAGLLKEAFVPLPTGQRLDPERFDSLLAVVHDARNEIAHHRGVSRNLHSKVRTALADILSIMEFDEERAFDRVVRAAADVRRVA